MLFPELVRTLKGFLPDNRPIALNLKSGVGSELIAADWYFRNGFPRIGDILAGGMRTWSGETVSRETALSSPTIYACNQVVSGTIGYIPATLMRARDGQRIEATQHPMFEAMKHEPNEEMTAQTFRELVTSHCLLGGNGYAKIIRRSGTGTAIQLRHIDPDNVFPDRETTGEKRVVYVIKERGIADKTYTIIPGKLHDILHLRGIGWDGVKGYSVLHTVRHSIGTTIAADRNVATFWRNGGRVPYAIEMPKRFATKEDADKWRADWMERMADPHNPPILDLDMKYKQTGLSMVDAQAIEFRQAMISELCRPFDVQPHLVGDLSRATFNNIEELALQFEKITLSKWLERWRQDFRRCVLTPDEKAAGYYLHQNLDALRRGDFVKRMEGYASALQNGHLSIDEVRELEDRNALPNGAGAHWHIQLNMGTVGNDGQVQAAPRPSSLVRLDQQST